MRAAVRVEVLHHEGCPLFAPALELVRDCVRELGVDAVVSGLDVPTRERVSDALRSALSSP